MIISKQLILNLEEKRADVKTIIEVESKRYEESKIRMQKIAANLKEKNQVPNVDDLIRMYESDGITPDYLKELEVIPEIPPTFYSKLSDLHQTVDTKQKEKLPLEGILQRLNCCFMVMIHMTLKLKF